MLGRGSIVLFAVALGGLVACTKSEDGETATSSAPESTARPAATSAATTAPPASASAPATATSASAASAATLAAPASATAPATSASAASAATAGVTTKLAPSAIASAAASAAAPECGDKGQPACPLQGWMKATMTPAVSAGDAAAIAVALEKTAAFAPAGYANWASISRDGARAARSGDLAAAKQSCRACHDQYKAKYKAEIRARKI